MVRKEEWITTKAAAAILTENSGHEVSDAYVRRLGIEDKLITKQIDERTKLYLKSSVETYRVRQRAKKKAEDAA